MSCVADCRNTCKWRIKRMLSDRETQSGLKQSPAPVLFGKRAPAVLKRTPDPLSHSSTNLFLHQTWTFWQRPRVASRTASALIYNIRWAKLFIFSCNTSNQTNIRHSKLVLWRKTDMQRNVIINRNKMRTHLSVNNTKLLASCDHSARLSNKLYHIMHTLIILHK